MKLEWTHLIICCRCQLILESDMASMNLKRFLIWHSFKHTAIYMLLHFKMFWCTIKQSNCIGVADAAVLERIRNDSKWVGLKWNGSDQIGSNRIGSDSIESNQESKPLSVLSHTFFHCNMHAMYVNRSKWYVILCVNNATVRFKAYNIFYIGLSL